MPQWVSRFKPSSLMFWGLSLAWLGAIAVLTLVWGLGDIGLIDETEPLFVEASRQMLITGDWITPYFDGVTRFDKPPLIYWLMVLSFKVFGVSEWAARLPSVLSGIGIVLLCFYVLLHHSPPLKPEDSSPVQQPRRNWLAAWLGSTMLMLNLNTYFWGRTGYADMLLLACMGGTLLAFFMGYAQTTHLAQQQRWYRACAVFTAFGILTKGPIALLLPALIMGAFTLYLGNFRQIIGEIKLFRSLAIILALALPWYILVTLANGEAFIDSFFGYHNLERFSSVVNQHSGPWYFHILVILVGFLPWSAYLPVALVHTQVWQRQAWQRRSRSEQLGLYAGFWFVIVWGFFTLSVTKYFSYTLPLMPAAAILVSLLWTQEMTHHSLARPSRWSISRWFNVFLMGLLAWALWNCPQWLTQDPWMPTLGEAIATARIPLYGGLLWAVAAGLAVLCILRRSSALWLVNAIAFILFISLVLHPAVRVVDQARQLPLRTLATTAIQVQQPNQPIVMIGFRKPSLVYYTQQPIEYLETPQELPDRFRQTPKGKRNLQNPYPLVITTPQLLAATTLTPQAYRTVEAAGAYVLVNLAQNR